MHARRLAVAALVAAAGVALGYASSASSSGTTTSTSPPGTTAPPATTTGASTTAPTPTTSATTNATTAVPLPPPPTAAAPRDLDRGCLAVAAVALWLPGHPLPLVLGPAGHAPWAKTPARRTISYPAGGAAVSAGSVELTASGCPSRGGGTVGGARVGSLSLFDGAVTVDSVTLHVDADGIAESSAVSGLRVDGAAVATPAPGQRVRLGSWGYLVVFRNNPVKLHETGTAHARSRVRAVGLVVHLLERRDGIPAGTDVQVALADLTPAPSRAPALPRRGTAPANTTKKTAPALRTVQRKPALAPKRAVAKHAKRPRVHVKKRPRRSHAPTHEPLTVTPPLGARGLVFPVAGNASYGDTYGGLRTDVSGGWHHGDDIFAPLGTPVVAVASGTLNRVGWERLGGWRLWVRDRAGDEFYYAHLSGYTPLALHSKRVRAGQVLGFVGNTGDAFPTTPPHLHFEIHPRTLLRLKYDGAVDPSSYLERWRRVQHVRAPYPVLPRVGLSSAEIKREASIVFRKLLSDRGLKERAAHAKARSRATGTASSKKRAKASVRREAGLSTAGGPGAFDPIPLALVALAAAALVGAGCLRLRRMRAAAVVCDDLDAFPEARHTETR